MLLRHTSRHPWLHSRTQRTHATLARRLQTLDQHKAVVIVTGRATVELREEFCVLEKPFTEPGLRHSVEAARVRAAGGAAAGPNPSPA